MADYFRRPECSEAISITPTSAGSGNPSWWILGADKTGISEYRQWRKMVELPSRAELLSPEQRRDLTAPALRTFFRIAGAWSLSEIEQAKILGLPDPTMVRQWQGKGAAILEAETLERISYVFGIFEGINTLLPSPSRADAWMRTSNSAPLFEGKSPIDRLLAGDIDDLRLVRRYLDAEVWASP